MYICRQAGIQTGMSVYHIYIYVYNNPAIIIVAALGRGYAMFMVAAVATICKYPI